MNLLIVVYVNNFNLFLSFIEKIKGINNLELLVVDNSQSNALDNIGIRNLKIVKTETRIGFAQSNNYAISNVNTNSYDNIILSNYDLEFEKKDFSLFVKSVTNNKNSLITCKMKDLNGKKWPTTFYWNKVLGIVTNKKYLFGKKCVSGCLVSIPSFVINEKIFDDRFFMYNEDIDMSLTFNNLKIEVLEIEMTHMVSAVSNSVGSFWRVEKYIESRLIMLKKYKMNPLAYFINYLFFIKILIKEIKKINRVKKSNVIY